MSTIGDYYADCGRRAKTARHALAAAQCGGCRGHGFLGEQRCGECNATGRAPGVTYERLRWLRSEYERAQDTGD